MRASGVFTGTTNSPSRSPRQSLYHSTIRAGRNLPDKEFRSMLLLLHAIFLREAGRTFLSSSACRHAVRTISSPAFAGDWRVVSEDSELFPTRSFLRIVRASCIFTNRLRIGR